MKCICILINCMNLIYVYIKMFTFFFFISKKKKNLLVAFVIT